MELFTLFDLILALSTRTTRIIRLRLTGLVRAYAEELLRFKSE
jgi:hypothetical protein